MTRNVIDILEERQFIEATTSDELKKICSSPINFYYGIDPTASSLHLGNLVGLIASIWFQRAGHTPYLLIGGGTGRIGDPSGKSIERPLLSEEQIEQNIAGIRSILEKMLDFDHPTAAPVIVNNLDWLNSFNLIDFLRDVGKSFRLGPMLAKESVKQRVNSEEGMSFTEFSYQVLQGYDFFHLFTREKVKLQIGGSDQWGNITAGVELTRKLKSDSVYGLTYPLLTRSDGKKFGKSEKGAVWLDETSTSVFDFYQYFMKIPDSDVPKLMRMLTFMDIGEIQEIEASLSSGHFTPNAAQSRLAEEMTRFIHGEAGLAKAKKITEAASFGSAMSMDVEVLEKIAKDFPKRTLRQSEVEGKKYTDLLVECEMLSSKGEASRLVKNNGAYLNNEKVLNTQTLIEKKDIIGGKYLILGAGKKNKMLIKIEG